MFRSPARLAESGFLRREIAGRMFERLDLVRIAPHTVLDAGCGEGADLGGLHQRFSSAQLLGLDASAPMLKEAILQRSSAMSATNRLFSRLRSAAGLEKASEGTLICGDFGQLPLPPASVDLVWSNLALHWHPQADKVFAEWRRVLKVDGLLMFSCFGPDTFKELRAAYQASDGAPQTLPFVDMHDFGDMLIDSGFATPVMDMETITVTYDSAKRLLDDVRALGGNPLETRRAGLATRGLRERVLRSLDGQRGPDGKIPLTVEVIYGHAFRPAPRTTSAGEAIVRFEPRR